MGAAAAVHCHPGGVGRGDCVRSSIFRAGDEHRIKRTTTSTDAFVIERNKRFVPLGFVSSTAGASAVRIAERDTDNRDTRFEDCRRRAKPSRPHEDRAKQSSVPKGGG